MCANLDTTRAAKIHAVLTRKGKQWAGLTLSANTTVLFRKRNGYGLPDLITLNKTELSRRASQMRGSRDPLMRAIIDHRTAHQASNKTAQMLFDPLETRTSCIHDGDEGRCPNEDVQTGTQGEERREPARTSHGQRGSAQDDGSARSIRTRGGETNERRPSGRAVLFE